MELGNTPEQPVPESIVEQEIQEVEADIRERFAAPDKPERLQLKDAVNLLRATPYVTAIAVQALELHPGASEDVLYRAANRVYIPSMATKYQYDEAQLLAINRHPLMRTTSIAGVAELLSASVAMVATAAKGAGLEPAVSPQAERRNSRTGQDVVMQHRYNKDQILVLNEAIKRFNAPENVVAESRLISMYDGLSPAALKDIENQLEIQMTPYRNPDIGQGEDFLSTHDTVRILRALREQGYQRAKK